MTDLVCAAYAFAELARIIRIRGRRRDRERIAHDSRAVHHLPGFSFERPRRKKDKAPRFTKATPPMHPLGCRRERRRAVARGLYELIASHEWELTLGELRSMWKDEPDTGRSP